MKSFYKGDAGVKLAAVKEKSRHALWSAAFFIGFACLGASETANAQSFTTASSSSFPTVANAGRIAIADFDNDGDEDILYQTGTTAGSPFNYARNNGNGTYTIVAQASSPFSGVTLPDMGAVNLYKVADFDRDNDLDIWVPTINTTGIYLRNDAGTFTNPSSSSFPTVGSTVAHANRYAVGDFDNDGDPDILYQTNTTAGSPFAYLRNNGNATFTSVAISSSPFATITFLDMSVINAFRIADFDGDNDDDIWATANASSGEFYRNDGGSFSEQNSSTFPAAANSARAIEGDFDADGDVDILYQTPSTAGSPFYYARSNGDGTFTNVAQSASPFQDFLFRTLLLRVSTG